MRVEVHPQELTGYLEQSECWRAEYEAHFAVHHLLEVWYENVLADFDGEMDRIQSWLGVSPRKLTPRTQRQITRPLSEIVVNYAGLKAQFATTRWAGLFDE